MAKRRRTRKGNEVETSGSTGDVGPTSGVSLYTAALVFALVGRPAEWIPGLSSIPLTRIAFLVAAIAALRSLSTLAPVRVLSLPSLRSGMAFLLLAFVSIAFSIYKAKSLEFMPGPFILLLSVILITKTIASIGDLERVFVAVVMAALALAVGTLLAYQGGRADIDSAQISYDPNDLAYVLVTILPICAALYVTAGGGRKVLLAAGMVAMVFTVLLTGSRGGALALLLIAALATLRPLSLDKDGRLLEGRVGTVISRAAMLIVALVIAWFAAPLDTRELLLTLADLGSDYNMNLSDNSSRLLVWKRSSAAVLTRPIGFGLGTFETVDGRLGGLYKAAHNTLVQAFVELGFLGLLLLSRAYYLSWRELLVAERLQLATKDPPPRALSRVALYSRALRLSLAGNLAAGFFLSQAYGAMLWTLIALCAALIALRGRVVS